MLAFIKLLLLKCSLWADFNSFERPNPTINLVFVQVPHMWPLYFDKPVINDMGLTNQCRVRKVKEIMSYTPETFIA